MATFEQRVDRYAQDLYAAAGGPFVTVNQLRQYLGSGKKTAKDVLAPLVPATKAKYSKYYYRDVAEELAKEA